MADKTSQTPAAGKEPMIGQDQRPTAIDFNAPLASLKVSDFVTLHANEYFKVEKEVSKEIHKEHFKPEKEFHKPEYFKPEYYKPEYFKPELLKGEGLKVEKEVKPDPIDQGMVEQVATRVVDMLKQQGLVRQG